MAAAGVLCSGGHRVSHRGKTGKRVDALEHFAGRATNRVLHVDQSLGGQRQTPVRTALQQSDRILEARAPDGDRVELVGEAPVERCQQTRPACHRRHGTPMRVHKDGFGDGMCDRSEVLGMPGCFEHEPLLGRLALEPKQVPPIGLVGRLDRRLMPPRAVALQRKEQRKRRGDQRVVE